jgi:hypothetical protein
MIYISHRGNINGKDVTYENNPEYIIQTLNKGYNVEIDVRLIKDSLYLGHDEAVYLITLEWLLQRKDSLWIHCKNIESLQYFYNIKHVFNYFWHDTDAVTFTSKNYIWAYPGKQPILNSVAVLPEMHNDDVSKCIGICSDIIEKYRFKT